MGWRWALRSIWWQRVLGFNRHVPWPCSPFILVGDASKIQFHVDDLNNFQGLGNYYQTSGNIVIGRGTWIAPNVGIITGNHNPENPDEQLDPEDVVIGEHCWIGMNAVILPGVHLGDHTVVGAGAVVTKSYPQGHCVVAGVPARVVREWGP